MRSESNGHSFANGNGASNSQGGTGGFDYDMNTGRPDPESHWWLLV